MYSTAMPVQRSKISGQSLNVPMFERYPQIQTLASSNLGHCHCHSYGRSQNVLMLNGQRGSVQTSAFKHRQLNFGCLSCQCKFLSGCRSAIEHIRLSDPITMKGNNGQLKLILSPFSQFWSFFYFSFIVTFLIFYNHSLGTLVVQQINTSNLLEMLGRF